MMILRKRLNTQYEHPKMIEFCEAIAALPGIVVDSFTDIATGKFSGKALIFFHVRDTGSSMIQNNQPTGLFFLTRCLDRRYFRYGHLCQISLSVGDLVHFDGTLPVSYCLEFESETLLASCDFLEEALLNLYYHLEHKDFIEAYQIDLTKFHLIDKRQEDRVDALEKLGI